MSLNVSFVIGVLNERERLPRVLRTIAAQQGFSGSVEIVVADGGSTDGTAEVAIAAGARVIENPLRRCEPGIALGVQAATGDVVIVMAADNPLADEHFLERIIKPFQDPAVMAALPLVVATGEDGLTVRYLNCFTDPFNHFVYWNGASPLTYDRTYEVVRRHDDYVVYHFNTAEPPLIALAQGFAFRRGMRRPAGSQEDDVSPVEALIQGGATIAVVPGARIEHHTVRNYHDFIRKFESRIVARLRDRTMAVWRRTERHSVARRLRRTLWPFYAISFIFPALVSLYGAARDRRTEWLLHPFLTFGLGAVFWKQTILYYIRGRQAGHFVIPRG